MTSNIDRTLVSRIRLMDTDELLYQNRISNYQLFRTTILTCNEALPESRAHPLQLPWRKYQLHGEGGKIYNNISENIIQLLNLTPKFKKWVLIPILHELSFELLQTPKAPFFLPLGSAARKLVNRFVFQNSARTLIFFSLSVLPSSAPSFSVVATVPFSFSKVVH